MSTDDYQHFIQQLNQKIADVEKQKRAFAELTQAITDLEHNAQHDAEAAATLRRLQQRQQETDFMALRAQAESELMKLTGQLSQMKKEAQQQQVTPVLPDSQVSTQDTAKPVSRKITPRHFI